MALRDEFPVLERVAYLNAGTDGPVPRAACELARGELTAQTEDGRLWPHFERRHALTADLRAGYASLLGCDVDDVAVTTGTSYGLGSILAGLDVGPGDEIVTSDNEHPGLLGPLIAARHRGATVRAVPFAELADAVRATTTLVAASHVNWITGEVAPADLAEVTAPVILDGAQGAGASPSTSRRSTAWPTPPPARSGCAARTGPGCCTCGRSSASACARSRPATWPSRTPPAGWIRPSAPAGGASTRRSPREAVALSLAAYQALVAAGFDESFERAADLADVFARRAAADAAHRRGARALHAGRLRVPRAGGGAPAARGARRRRAQPARGRRTCGSRSAPGTTSPTSTGCWKRS